LVAFYEDDIMPFRPVTMMMRGDYLVLEVLLVLLVHLFFIISYLKKRAIQQLTN
jgi:hypothetical protein